MFTHRLYNLIVAAVFVVVVALAVQQALATKAIVPESNSAHTESSEPSLREEQPGATPQGYATISSYRSPLDECFDVSLREVASCRNASQEPVSSYRSPLDECFDVSLREAASCRKASQAPVPSYRFPREVCFDVPLGGAVTCPIESPTLVTSYRSPLDECYDVPLREVTNCRNAGQASAP